MRRVEDQTIANKALLLGLVPTLAAVALVLFASMLSTYLRARDSQQQDLETESAIVAENVSPALAFHDPHAAADIANAFRAKDNIDAVCVFDDNAALFASFVQNGGTCESRRDRPIAPAPSYER